MADTEAVDTGKSEKEKILARARKRFSYINEQDRENRAAQRTDTEFVYVSGKTWTDEARRKRKAWGDPCMEFPQLKQFVSQVVNDQRQSRPGIRIHPASGEASEEVAEILQGMIRGIEYDSRAESVYDGGYQSSVVGGRGYWRIVNEYESEDSFNQKLVIKRVPDALSVYLDPDFQDADGGDRMYGFVVEAVPEDEFKDEHPKADASSVDLGTELWHPGDDKILVADYYERTCVRKKLVLMSDGNKGWKDDLPPKPWPPGIEIVSEREADAYTVKWYKIAGGDQILEEHEWPGEIIPLVCTMGDEIIIDGKRIYQGLIAQAKDAQSMFDYGMTQQAIHLGLTPRAPYIAAFGQTEQFGDMWAKANERNYGVLVYNPVEVNENVLPPPQRQMGSTPDQGWMNWTQQMTGLMRSTIGMYQNSLGMQGQEVSGRAILAREKQGDNATFHFQDNLSRAIALTGRIIVECIPAFYDTERIVNTVGIDDTRKAVKLNERMPDPDDPLTAIMKNDVTSGKYAVTVQAGPTYATKRQETADLLMGMVQAYPPLMQLAGDLVMKAQDVPDAEAIAARLKLALPPQILQQIQADEQSENGGPKPLPPEVQAQMAQMQQQLQQGQQMMQALQAENQQLKSGDMAKQAEIQSKAQTESMKMQATSQSDMVKAQSTLEVESIKAQAEAAKSAADNETRRYDSIVAAATQIVTQAMQVPEVVPGEQAAQVDIATSALAPVVGPEVEALRELAQGMLAMAQQTAEAAKLAAMPRQIMIQRGPDGRVSGGTSAVA